MSQSPQAGQFNSNTVIRVPERYESRGLNPLKRVNSILTPKWVEKRQKKMEKGLNPLKRVNSILT